MNEISISILIFSILSGIAAIGRISGKLHHDGTQLLRPLSDTVLFFNIWLVFWLVNGYFVNHMLPDLPLPTAMLINRIIKWMEAMLGILWCGFYFHLLDAIIPMRQLSGFQIKALRRTGYLIMAALTAAAVADPLIAAGAFHAVKNIGLDSLILLALGASMRALYLIKNGPSAPRPARGLILIFCLMILLFCINKAYYYINPDFAQSNRIVFIENGLALILNVCILGWFWRNGRFFETAPVQNTGVMHMARFHLSKRELEIVTLVSEGKSNQEIADSLYISLKTVKAHLYNTFQKTAVNNRTQLAQLYLRGNAPA